MQTDILNSSDAPENVAVETDDRRRPGRTDVDPILIPLLRLSSDGSASYEAMRQALHTQDAAASVDYLDEEESEPARGFLLALYMAIPIWLVVALLTYYSF